MTETLYSQFATFLAAALLIPGVLFFAYGTSHRNMLFWWAASLAYFLIFLGSALGAARASLPLLVSTFLANALIGFGYVLCLRSVRLVKSYWGYRWVEYIAISVFLLGLFWVNSFNNTYPARVALVSSLIAIISGTAVITVLKSKPRMSALGDMTLIVFAFGNTAFAALRGTTALFGRTDDFTSFAVWDQVFFIWSIAAVFCFAVGLFLNGTALISQENRMALEKERRLVAALTEALQGQRNLQKLILHELKRPLNSIMTTIQLSRHNQTGMPPDEVARVHTLASLANEYLRSIGDYEDIQALLDSPALVDVPVDDLVKDTENKWQVKIHVSEADNHALFPVDPFLFDITIGNLIDNARKFGHTEENICVTVQVNPGNVSFDVTDDGPGIPPKEVEKVFGQFYKMNDTQTNAATGCGLGLYLSRRIAEAHGGTCVVVSQQPSTLRLTFPRSNLGGNRE